MAFRCFLALLIPLALFAQRKSNTTRTQTIHAGEPSTTHPGGNPGRTTSKTGTNSPFKNAQPKPAEPKPADKPPVRACPQDHKVGVPDTIGSWKFEGDRIGPVVLKNTSVAPDTFTKHIACDLNRIYKTASGKLLFSAIDSELARVRQKRPHDAFVHIEYKTDTGGGPSTTAGGLAMKWFIVQPKSLPEVFGDIPRRPKNSNGETDWDAPAEFPKPLPKLVTMGASMIRGMGVGSTINFDPDAFPLARWNSTTPSHVALFHEMVHVLRFLEGRADRTPIPDSSDPSKVNPTWLIVDERDVIDGSTRVTENEYREQVGLARRECVAPKCF